MKSLKKICLALLFVIMPLLITSCGTKDNTTATDDTTTNSVDKTTITGSIFAAPVANASVSVMDVDGNTIAGPVMTMSDGTYSISIPTTALTSTLRFESVGGTFDDEASSLSTTAGKLAAYLEGGSLTTGSAVHLDPSSTIIHDMVTSGSGTSLAAARAMFNAMFGYTPDTSIQPLNTAPTGTLNAPNRLAALRAAAFSHLAKDMGISPAKQFALVSAIAQDLGDDGKLNGSVGSVDGTSMTEDLPNKFEAAMISFMSNTMHNNTGLTTAEIGSLPFGKVVLTNTYRVEYLPGMMPAIQGKTSFKIKVVNRSNGTPASGLTLKLMPLMHMPTRNHATPVDAITDNGDGTYSCTAYYLMASGPGMGFWELKVMIGSGMSAESATFHPAVGMAMGTTTGRATLKGVADKILSMPTGTATESRSYYLFNDGLTSSMGSYSFKLFIATKESMMSYPAVGTGTTLKDEQTASWVVNPITVDASTDTTTWLPATEGTVAGHWTIAGLTGLSSGQTGTIYVRMSVNNEVKSTNGMVTSPTSTNGYAAFTVTPAMSGM